MKTENGHGGKAPRNLPRKYIQVICQSYTPAVHGSKIHAIIVLTTAVRLSIRVREPLDNNKPRHLQWTAQAPTATFYEKMFIKQKRVTEE
jgi:hypothetical protein